jgi:hypothetical protein
LGCEISVANLRRGIAGERRSDFGVPPAEMVIQMQSSRDGAAIKQNNKQSDEQTNNKQIKSRRATI